MIRYVSGNIFDFPGQTLVNPVNCNGVMGKGLARQFKDRYPLMFDQYRKVCRTGKFHEGNLLLHYEADHWILNFPTKLNWREPSKLEYIEAGLSKFVEVYHKIGIESIAFPKLGVGEGRLKWSDVRTLMEKYLAQLTEDEPLRHTLQVWIYQ